MNRMKTRNAISVINFAHQHCAACSSFPVAHRKTLAAFIRTAVPLFLAVTLAAGLFPANAALAYAASGASSFEVAAASGAASDAAPGATSGATSASSREIPSTSAQASSQASAQQQTLTRTITWLSTDDQPAFPESINQENITFFLVNSAIEKIDTQYGTTVAQRTNTVSCAPEELATTQASFPAALEVNENGYAGTIPLAETTYEPVYAQRSWEVNQVRTFAGLPNNDAVQIAADLAFDNPETQHSLALRLASLSWTVDSLDAQGLPASYTASALYRGTDTADVLDYYQVTARYEGNVQALEPVTIYQATLTYQAPAIVSEEQATPEKAEGFPVVLAAAIAAAAAAAAAVGVFFWRRRHDVRVCRIELQVIDAQGAKEQLQTLKVIARTTAKRAQDGSLAVEIPPSVDMSVGKFALMLAPNKADGSTLVVLWCGKLVARTHASKVVYL